MLTSSNSRPLVGVPGRSRSLAGAAAAPAGGVLQEAARFARTLAPNSRMKAVVAQPLKAEVDAPALIARVADGDVRAYRELVDRYLPGIHNFAARLLGNRAEAEEVCQETFLRLWNKAGSFVPHAKPATWLYRIAHNLAVDRLRSRREVAAPAVLEDAPASGRPSVALSRKRVALAVQAALAELPERQRAALELVHYQGMTSAEAAEVLGVNVRALESLLARGRRKLREVLADVDREHGEGQ
jgi:RNA polymerase sigma-70 factor, ECF subfamily